MKDENKTHNLIDFCNENISGAEVRKLCGQLQKGKVQALAIRDSTLTDKDYKNILKHVTTCSTIRHLSLTVSLVTDNFRIQLIGKVLKENTYISGLFLHGNPIGNNGIKTLHPYLSIHPALVALDVGDCQIGDDGLELICTLLADNAKKPGLRELILSSNPDITSKGWTKLGVAMAAGNKIRTLHVDYNELGDASASSILISIAGSRCMENLDMECTGITEATGQVLLHLVQNYRMKFTIINLTENQISQSTIEEIKLYIPELLDTDQENDVQSEDTQSLATSEPPLDNQSEEGDVANASVSAMANLNSPDYKIAIVGSTDSVANTLTPAIETSGHVTDMKVFCVQKGKGSLADRIISKSASMNHLSDVSGADMMSLQSRSFCDMSCIKVPECIVQRPEIEYNAYTPTEDLSSISENKSTTIEMIEKVEDIDDESCLSDISRTSCNLLVLETPPEVVSLHSYKDGSRGQDDISFQPMESLFTARRSSAPVSKQTKTKTISKKEPLPESIKLKENRPRSGKFSNQNKSSTDLVSRIHDTRRRLSDASCLGIVQSLPDSDERLTRSSVNIMDNKGQGHTGSRSSMFGDVELEEL